MQQDRLVVDRTRVAIGLADRLGLIKDRLARDDMARDGLIMVSFGLLAGLFNYLYQLSMSILLTPAEFGTVFSLFSLFLIILWFPQALQTPIAKFVSASKTRGQLGAVNYIWKFSLRRTLVLGLAVFIVSAAVSPLVSRLLNIDNNLYAVLVFASFILAFSLPVNFGVMRGLQRFVPLGFSVALWAFLRLSIAVLLVYVLRMGIYGGLLPLVLAPSITFLVTLYFLKGMSKAGNEKVDLSTYRSYTGFALIALVCFAVATNVDVILAKHYLSSDNAGVYSAISVLGKVALIAPAGIAVAMFPKACERFEIGKAHKPLLQKAILCVLIIGGGTVVFYLLFPDFVIDVVLRGKYAIEAAYLFKIGLGMLFFSLSFVLLNYFLSLNQTRRVTYPVLATAVLQLGLIYLFHSNIGQFVNVILVSGAVCLALMIILYQKTMNELTCAPSV